jgi:tetratricopeptide (TPR) repeat protein
MINAVVSYVYYLKNTFLPFNLAAFYPFVYSFPLWQVLYSAFILMGITVFVVYYFKKMPFLPVGWFWYLGTLVPVSGLLPVGAPMADHYTYLPSIGIAIMLAWGIPVLIKNEDFRKKILLPAGIIFIIILAVLTWQQCGYWENSIKLWDYALKVTKNNVTAYSRLGTAYFTLGQNQQAIENFEKAIYLDPKYLVGYNRLGIAYSKLGRYQQAIENFNKAIRLKPDFVDAYNNRAVVYFTLGDIDAGCSDARKACVRGECRVMELAKGEGYCR